MEGDRGWSGRGYRRRRRPVGRDHRPVRWKRRRDAHTGRHVNGRWSSGDRYNKTIARADRNTEAAGLAFTDSETVRNAADSGRRGSDLDSYAIRNRDCSAIEHACSDTNRAHYADANDPPDRDASSNISAHLDPDPHGDAYPVPRSVADTDLDPHANRKGLYAVTGDRVLSG